MMDARWIRLPRLFHGSSTLYLSRFEVGTSPQEWPYRTGAYALLGAIRDAAADTGVFLKIHERNILEQKKSSMNWQHGELYATPSIAKAIEYAVPNAARGGELLTVLRGVADRIGNCNYDAGERVDRLARSLGLHQFVDGGGHPIIVAIDGLTSAEVATENGDEADQEASRLNELRNSPIYQVVCQQINFRVRQSSGTVSDIANVKVEDPSSWPFRCTIEWRGQDGT